MEQKSRSRTIWKFAFNNRTWNVGIPAGSIFLAFQMQHDKPCLWAEVSPENPLVEWEFTIIGTGNDIPVGSTYYGTTQEAPFVWHLYGRKTRR